MAHTVVCSPPYAQDEDEKEEGMLVLTQARPPDGGDRLPLTREQVLAEYAEAAGTLDSFPTMPQHGFGAKTKYGPWYVYLDWELCHAGFI